MKFKRQNQRQILYTRDDLPGSVSLLASGRQLTVRSKTDLAIKTEEELEAFIVAIESAWDDHLRLAGEPVMVEV